RRGQTRKKAADDGGLLQSFVRLQRLRPAVADRAQMHQAAALATAQCDEFCARGRATGSASGRTKAVGTADPCRSRSWCGQEDRGRYRCKNQPHFTLLLVRCPICPRIAKLEHLPGIVARTATACG